MIVQDVLRSTLRPSCTALVRSNTAVYHICCTRRALYTYVTLPFPYINLALVLIVPHVMW